jgi:hypothetical protein
MTREQKSVRHIEFGIMGLEAMGNGVDRHLEVVCGLLFVVCCEMCEVRCAM